MASTAGTGSLLNAARVGDLEKVESLVALGGINVEERDSVGRTALMLAAENGRAEVVRCLLRVGVNIEARQRRQQTALHIAAESQSAECVSALIEAGARVDVTDANRNTALLLVMKRDRKYMNNTVFEIMKRLIDAPNCPLDWCDEQQRTALHYASYRAVGTELLLSARASPNLQDEDGNSPLHMAAIEGFDTVVRCLTTFNCNPNLVNHSGKMAVHYLAMKGHWEGIDDIVRCGGYLDHVDNENKTPLWHAVNHNRLHAVSSLLRGNCCPDLVAINSQVARETGASKPLSPLALALTCKYHAVARQLLLAGCDVGPLREVVALRDSARRVEREVLESQSHMLRDLMSELGEESGEELRAMGWFSEWVATPPTLKQLCRVMIRECVRGRIVCRAAVERLSDHLPAALQYFIELKELQDLELPPT